MNKRVFNLANLFSLLRLLLIIPLIFLILNKLYLASFFLGLVMLGTDLLDGYYARKYKTSSDFGVFLDFIVDQTVFGIGLAILLYMKNSLNFLTLIYILTFFILVITMLVIRNKKRFFKISLIHKRVAFLFLTMGLCLLFDLKFLFHVYLSASFLSMITLIVSYNYLNLFPK